MELQAPWNSQTILFLYSSNCWSFAVLVHYFSIYKDIWVGQLLIWMHHILALASYFMNTDLFLSFWIFYCQQSLRIQNLEIESMMTNDIRWRCWWELDFLGFENLAGYSFPSFLNSFSINGRLFDGHMNFHICFFNFSHFWEYIS